MMLDVKNLACRRGMRMVLRDISFTLSAGDALLVTGANGSGKSTLLRVLAGLFPMQQGTVMWNGAVVDWADHRSRIHYIGHQHAVKPELTVAEMMDYWQVLRGTPTTTNTENKMVDQFGLKSEMQTRFLSAGQKHRLALTRLLMNDALLWLLDEPATALDVTGVKILSEIIHHHRASGGIAIIAAHHGVDIDDAKTLFLSGSTP